MSKTPANYILPGIGVVIDDMAKSEDIEDDAISDILKQIDDANIPRLLYENLPSTELRNRFQNVAFILLDWELWGRGGGAELERQGVEDNIAFLKSLRDVCFAPVFIFSHYGVEGIKAHLREAELLEEPDNRSFILVRHKDDFKRSANNPGNPLLNAVNEWIAGNPSIYVLTHWNAEVARSQNRLFWDFYDKDTAWPSVLWRAYEADHDSPDHAIVDILLRNMCARMTPLALSPELVAPESVPKASTETLHSVLETSMIAPSSTFLEQQYGCGDMFKGQKKRYLINIRCDCDCLPKEGQDINEVVFYILEAESISPTCKAFKDSFSETYGQTQPHHGSHILFPVNGRALRIDFSDMLKMTLKDITEKGFSRVGRLTSPYITHIRQRYALYLQREGLPRIPNAAVPSLVNAEE